MGTIIGFDVGKGDDMCAYAIWAPGRPWTPITKEQYEHAVKCFEGKIHNPEEGDMKRSIEGRFVGFE